MAKIKVFKGTRSSDAPRLCDSCESGLIMRGAADSQEQVFCLRMNKHVTTRITECNQYVDRTQPPVWALKLHEDEDLIPRYIE